MAGKEEKIKTLQKNMKAKEEQLYAKIYTLTEEQAMKTAYRMLIEKDKDIKKNLSVQTGKESMDETIALKRVKILTKQSIWRSCLFLLSIRQKRYR